MKKIFVTLMLMASCAAMAHDYGPHPARIIAVIERYEFRTEYRYGEVCGGWPINERGDYYYEERPRRDGRPVAGAVIGAIIGSQIGDGNGQVAATAIGAITGAAIGDRHRDRGYEEQRYYERHNDYERRHHRRRGGDCRMESYPVRIRNVYYDVVYDHHGRIGTVRMYNHPRGRYVHVYE